VAAARDLECCSGSAGTGDCRRCYRRIPFGSAACRIPNAKAQLQAIDERGSAALAADNVSSWRNSITTITTINTAIGAGP